MTDFIKITRMLLSILTVIFLFQLVFYDTTKIQLQVIEYIHNSPVIYAINLISKFLTYEVLYLLYFIFFINVFIFQPNIIDNAIYIIYCSSCFFLTPYLKLLIAELRPFMTSRALQIHKLTLYDCQSNFGMPSDDIISLICIFYLFKVYLYDKQRHIVLSEDINDEYEDENYLQNFFKFEKKYFILKPTAKVVNHDMPLSLFNAFFLSLILATGIIKILVGNSFMCQIIFSVIIGFFWSHYFFIYLRSHIRQFVSDIVVQPNSRKRATSYYILMIYALIASSFGLMLCREFFRNEEENEQFLELVSQKCDHFYAIEEQSLKDSLVIIVPLVMLTLYNFANITQKMQNSENKSQTFQDLNLKQKLKRFLIFGTGFFVVVIIKEVIDYIVVRNTEGNFYNFHNVIIYIISMILLGVFISILFPLMANKMGVLLQFEWIFIEDFEKFQTKKNPKKKTLILIAYREGEDREEKVADVLGKQYIKNDKIRLTDMADAKSF